MSGGSYSTSRPSARSALMSIVVAVLTLFFRSAFHCSAAPSDSGIVCTHLSRVRISRQIPVASALNTYQIVQSFYISLRP